MSDRWFLVPVSGSGTKTNPYYPKYSSEPGIDEWSGQRVTINASEYYVARLVGTTSALDTVEGNSDAVSILESSLAKSDIAAYLNDKTGHSYSFSKWEDRFLTGGV